jgi:hypothetical protein
MSRAACGREVARPPVHNTLGQDFLFRQLVSWQVEHCCRSITCAKSQQLTAFRRWACLCGPSAPVCARSEGELSGSYGVGCCHYDTNMLCLQDEQTGNGVVLMHWGASSYEHDDAMMASSRLSLGASGGSCSLSSFDLAQHLITDWSSSTLRV